MTRTFLMLGAASAFLGVAIGAFAAHALKSRLSADMLGIFEVGVRYQMYHAIGLCIVAWVVSHTPSASASGWLFCAGTILFSGSLYALSLTGKSWLGAITPVGGLCFLAGWAWLGWAVWKSA